MFVGLDPEYIYLYIFFCKLRGILRGEFRGLRGELRGDCAGFAENGGDCEENFAKIHLNSV